MVTQPEPPGIVKPGVTLAAKVEETATSGDPEFSGGPASAVAADDPALQMATYGLH